MSTHTRRRALALAILTLSGCGHVPLMTAWRMRNFDASRVDPYVVRAALQLPDRIDPRPGSLKLVFRYWPDYVSDGKTLEEEAPPCSALPIAP